MTSFGNKATSHGISLLTFDVITVHERGKYKV